MVLVLIPPLICLLVICLIGIAMLLQYYCGWFGWCFPFVEYKHRKKHDYTILTEGKSYYSNTAFTE